MRILRAKNRLEISRLSTLDEFLLAFAGQWVYVPKSAIKERAIAEGLAAGKPVDEIAAEAGVSRETVYRRARRR